MYSYKFYFPALWVTNLYEAALKSQNRFLTQSYVLVSYENMELWRKNTPVHFHFVDYPIAVLTSRAHSSYKSIKRMWGGVGVGRGQFPHMCTGINLGQCSRPHMAETSALASAMAEPAGLWDSQPRMLRLENIGEINFPEARNRRRAVWYWQTMNIDNFTHPYLTDSMYNCKSVSVGFFSRGKFTR